MGLANGLTVLRILLIPVFVTLLVDRKPGWALLVFSIAALTDLLDGWVARYQGIESRLGAFLDPMADKMLLMASFVTLTYLKALPFWITAVVITRDAMLLVGALIVAINGTPLRDAIDFQFYAADDRLRLTVERDDHARRIQVTRQGSDLGLELVPPRPRDIATCANKCVFCFIHQNPRGLRKSLYVKDDDFRLSFLHGNYITLSDLDEAALERIEAQRLSPLYISVHATDPFLRHALLGRPRHGAEILPRMERLARAGIRMHAQVVLCPDWNDGAHLERTIVDLQRLYPHVTTTAIVPVGLTRHRERLPQLRLLTADEARALITTVEGWQRGFFDALGPRGVLLDDATPADLARDLGVPVRVVEPSARALLRALRGP